MNQSTLVDTINMDSLTGTLHCKLLDRRSGLPLRSAHVTCSGDATEVKTFHADELGELRMVLPQGNFDLVVHANGYITLSLRGIAVIAGATSIVIRALVIGAGNPVLLPPASAIAGRVIAEDGLGEAHVTVQVTSPRSTHITQSDAAGNYFFHALPPETYSLSIRGKDGALRHEREVTTTQFMLARVDMSFAAAKPILESRLRIAPLDRSVNLSNR